MTCLPPAQSDSPHGLSATHISNSIGLARILLIFGLIFLHYEIFPGSPTNPFEGINLDDHPFLTWFNSFVVFFFHSAVPLLSMISGWLFFTFLPEDAWASLSRRMRGRVTSVYLPMCGWNLFYLAIVYTMFRLHPDSPTFSHATRFGIDFHHPTVMAYINSVFAITSNPIGFQFWFVRDLFVTAIFGPVWWFLIQRAPWVTAVVLGILWLSGVHSYVFLRLDVPFFFYMGAILHQKQLRIDVPLRLTVIAMTCFVLLAALRALAPLLVAFPDHVAPHWIDVATRTMRLFGVIGCWGVIYRLSLTRFGAWLSTYGGVAFFVHSAHWPLESIVKEALRHVITGTSTPALLLHYILSVTLTITICMTLALTLARFSPRLFSLMNGGRLLGQKRNQRHPSPIPVPAAAHGSVA
jgi:hypothetical protein